MNKQMLFLLMCVSPIVLNGMFNKPNAVTLEDLQKQINELRSASQESFARGIAVAGTAGVVAFYFLPKAKSRFHYGMGTLGAAAAGYGVNYYYNTLSGVGKTVWNTIQNNVVVRHPVLTAVGCAGVALICYNYEKVKTAITDTNKYVKDSSAYKYIFDESMPSFGT